MIFRQERIGKDGQPFTILKIETMRDGAVTRPRLRRWGLDELPQIVNVLRGDMAIFGPRPETPEIHAFCSWQIGSAWDARLRAKPGIVSLASVVGHIRSGARYDFDVKAQQAELDAAMIAAPFRSALAILFKLPRAILRGQSTEGGERNEAMHTHPAGLPADRSAL